MDENQVIVETKKILNGADISLNVMSALVPVFYGTGMAVQITTSSDPDLDQVKMKLAGEAALELCEEQTTIPYPSAIKHGSGTDFVYIGNIRRGPQDQPGLAFWLFADNIRTGGAANSLTIAENLVKDLL